MPSASITDFLRALEDAARILIASSFWFNPSEGKSIQGERKKEFICYSLLLFGSFPNAFNNRIFIYF